MTFRKSIKKGAITFLVSVFICSSLFAGAQKEEPAAKKGPVTVRLITQIIYEADRKDTFMEMMHRFEEQNPNTKVEFIGVPYEQIPQQLQIMVAGGNAPDLIHLDATYSIPLVAMQALADLKEYYSAEDIANIPKGLYNDSVIDGGLYSIPWNLGTIAVYGWKDNMKKAGLPMEIPNTWTEFKAAVRKVSNLGEGIYGFGARTSKTQNSAMWFLPVIWGHGGQFEDKDGKIVLYNQGTIDALNWYKELGTQKMTPLGFAHREVRDFTAKGNIGFNFDGPWQKSILRAVSGKGEAIDDSYIVGMYPEGVDGQRHGIQNGPALSISSQSKVKEHALKILRFLTEDEEIANFWFEKNAFYPANKKLLSANPVFAEDPFTQVFMQSAEFSRGYASTNPQYPTALEFIAVAMQEALIGRDTDKAAKRSHMTV